MPIVNSKTGEVHEAYLFVAVLGASNYTFTDLAEALERYALGLWNEHFYDKTKGKFDRHGDYFGRGWAIKGEYGNTLMFPKYYGWFLEIWSYAHCKSQDPGFRAEMAEYMTRLVGNPFEYELDGQILQALYQAEIAARRIEETEPMLVGERKVFVEHWYAWLQARWGNSFSPRDETALRLCHAHTETGRPFLVRYIQNSAGAFMKAMPSSVRGHAIAVQVLLYAEKLTNETEYLARARQVAEQAVHLYMDDNSPLPACSDVDRMVAPNGESFLPYYHAHVGCADLMYSLILLYERLLG